MRKKGDLMKKLLLVTIISLIFTSNIFALTSEEESSITNWKRGVKLLAADVDWINENPTLVTKKVKFSSLDNQEKEEKELETIAVENKSGDWLFLGVYQIDDANKKLKLLGKLYSSRKDGKPSLWRSKKGKSILFVSNNLTDFEAELPLDKKNAKNAYDVSSGLTAASNYVVDQDMKIDSKRFAW